MFVRDEHRARMHFLMVAPVWVLAALVFCGLSAYSQDQRQPVDFAAERAKQPKPPLSNQVVGIDIDRFVGNPLSSPVRVIDGVIFERSILRHGDPYHPGDPGAVLEYWKNIAHATLLGNTLVQNRYL